MGTEERSRPNPFFEQEALTVAETCSLIASLVKTETAFGLEFTASNDAKPPFVEFIINVNGIQSLVVRFIIFRP